jgi:hypothetical protein
MSLGSGWHILLVTCYSNSIGIRRHHFLYSLSGKGSVISVAILSNTVLTLLWCSRYRLLVQGPRLAVQMSHCWYHLFNIASRV